MKFKYGDSVVVKSGFYEGCTGIVLGYEDISNVSIDKHDYLVEVYKEMALGGLKDNVYINEIELEKKDN